MSTNEQDGKLTETRLDAEGKPRLFSRMPKEEHDEIMSAMPPEFANAVRGLTKPRPDASGDRPDDGNISATK